MELNDILSERQEQYGDPTENFRKIGIMWVGEGQNENIS